jgi:hypothetical protein
MTVPVEQLSFKPTTALGVTPITGSVKRAFGDWASDVINVKAFGAIGDNIANDTAAIQAAFDAACGPYSNPYSVAGVGTSKSVFFPAGYYKVTSPTGAVTITGCVANTTTVDDGLHYGCRLTLSNTGVFPNVGTANFTTGDMVYVRGVGGVAKLLNGFACSVVKIDGTHLDLFTNGSAAFPTFSGTYTRGGTVTKAAIQVKAAVGIRIFGDGSANTVLACSTTFSTTLSINGFYKGLIENMGFISDRGICVDINHDGSNIGPGINSHFIRINGCDFGGGGSSWPDYCVTFGFGYIRCDVPSVVNCSVGVGSRAGVMFANQNCLSGTIIGGNWAGNQAYANCTVTAASPTVVTRVSHQFAPGDAVKFSVDPEFVPGGGTLPSGIIAEANYYITEDAFFVTNYPSFHISDNFAHAMAGTDLVGAGSTGTAPIGVSLQSGPCIWVAAGSCPSITGGTFQNYHGPDIVITGDQNDAYSFSGCRTESMCFIDSPTGVLPLSINGCSMTSYYAGPDGYAFFVKGSGNWELNACRSAGGHAINNNSGKLILNSCVIDSDAIRRGFLPSNPGWPSYIQQNPPGISTVTAATYTLTGADPANKVLFLNNASAQTITIDTNANQKYGPGTVIEVQQTGTCAAAPNDKVVFTPAAGVTLNSRGGARKLNGQWAVGQLRCDATNVWTLSGDIVV